MRKFCLLILLFTSFYTFPQSSAQDSNIETLETYKARDSVRVRLLLNEANTILYNDPDKAFKLVDEAYDISSEMNWTKGLILSRRQEGGIYYSISDNLNAMDSFQEALKLCKDQPENGLVKASIYNNLGNIYADLQQFDKALDYYYQLLEISKASNKIDTEIQALVNIGTVLTEQGKMDEGISNLTDALNLTKELNNAIYEAAILNNLGFAYKTKKDYSKSSESYKKALEIAEATGNKYTAATALNSLGKVNLLLENYDLAETYSEKGLIVAKEIEAVEWQADAWETISKVKEVEKDYKASMMAYKNHIKLKDSIYAEENIAELTRKEMQFKADKEKALAEAEIEKQKLIKNGSIVGGGTLAVATIISFLFYRRKQTAKAQEKEANFNLQVADTELKALRAQMNPHFIFNSLNSINDYISKNDTESATNYLTKFSKLMRETLEKSSESEILLEDDIQILKTYMEIENKRTKSKFSYTFDIGEDIDPSNTLVPPMILQPFIENSIIHGLSTIKDGQITISFRKERDMLACTVEDNGIGRQKSNDLKGPQNRKSLGVSITKSRLEIINRKKNRKGDLNIIDLPNGTKVEVIIPLTLAY